MKSRVYIALFISLIYSKNITAQSHLYLDVAQVFSTFKFSSDDLQNNTAPGSGYSTLSSTAFGMGYEYADSNGLLIIAGFGIRKAGSSLVYNKINYSWILQYLDLKAGIGYRYNKWNIKPYVAASPFYAILLNARQTIGLNYYDLKAGNTIKSNDFGVFLTGGTNVPLSRLISIYLEYNYILGLRNIETAETQYLYNRGSAIKLGLLFNVSAAKAKQTPAVSAQPEIKSDNSLPSYQQTENNIAVGNPVNGTPSPKPSTNNDSELKENNQNYSGTNQNQSVSLNTTNNTISDVKKETENSSATSIDKSIPSNTNNNTISEVKKESTENKPLLNTTDTKKDSTGFKPEQEKLEDIQLKSISKIAVKKNITFKIQITAVKNELNVNHALLKNAKGLVKKEKGIDGWIRYYVGNFKTYESARFELDQMKSNGVAEDGFIVAFQNEKKITVADAKELLK